MIADLFINKKLDDTKYDIWRQKIQFLLNEHKVLEHLMACMSTRENKDENGKDVTTSEQYRESLKVYQTWFEQDRSPHYTILCCNA